MTRRSAGFFFAFSFLLPFTGFTNSSDTLVYRSGFEEKTIHRAIRGEEPDLMKLYSVITSDSGEYVGFSKKLDLFYSTIDDKVNSAKANKQKAKILFKEVHSYFFKRYQEEAFFNKVFENGTYNCVTGSMLYALVLKKYHIPFEIKEKPTHVYLVAFPGTENILFETTNPNGFYSPDEKLKREYVAGLVSMKFITQEYVNTVGVARAFNEYYYDNDEIDVVQLAGVQYYNRAVSAYTQEKPDEAIKNAVKMNLLYPCPKHQYYKIALLSSKLANSSYDNLKDILYLCEYANSTKDLTERRKVVGSFDQLLEDKLFKGDNDTLVTKAFGIIREKIQDEKIVADISYDYYLAMSQRQLMKGNMTKGMEYAQNAYAINQKDIRLQDLIVRALVMGSEKVRGTESNVKKLQDDAVQFPFLKKHKTYQALMTYVYGLRSYDLFSKNNGPEGYKYLELMETELKSMDGEKMILAEQAIAFSYAEAGAYHYRKKEYKTAREIIQKGLDLFPNNGELRERMKIVEDEL